MRKDAKDMRKMVMAVLLMPMAALATTWYVGGSSGSDYNSGTSQSSAKATIQAAIDASLAGDTILVAPGTYAPITSGNKSITIRSLSGAENTIIDGGGNYSSGNEINFQSTETPTTTLHVVSTNTVLHGFTIQHLVYVFGGTVRMCIIRDNDSSSVNGGVCYYSVVENCLIINNRGKNGAASDGSVLRNCTLVGNSARDIDGVCLNSILENCIVYGNGNNNRSTWQYWFDRNPLVTSFDYREKNVYVGDPGFVDAANGDYRLAAGSPCIDAGDNSYVTGDTDLAGAARIANGTVDIGCYEYGSSVPPTGGTTWYVNGSTGSDSNSGTSQSSAKATIQAAIDASAAGDTILVAPGTYGSIVSDNKDITIKSISGAVVTCIDGKGLSRCALLANGKDDRWGDDRGAQN